jgi:two-component system response regulator
MRAANSDKPILLVEDNPSDEELTLRALKKSNILNPVTVARDGAEALDYLLARGKHAAAPPPLPSVVLLDLKLPKINGLEVLRALRSEQRTRLLPVVILSSAPTATSESLSTSVSFSRPRGSSDSIGSA